MKLLSPLFEPFRGRFYYFIILTTFCMTFFTQSVLNQRRLLGTKIYEECSWCLELDEIPESDIGILSYLDLLLPQDPDFAADLLWMDMVYYFGRQNIIGESFDLLYPYINQITAMSKVWKAPYEYGAVVLPLFGNDPIGGYDLAKRGSEIFLDDWRLSFLKGYIEWKYIGDLESASMSFLEASRRTGAPKYLPYLAMTLSQKTSREELTELIFFEASKIVRSDEERKRLYNKLKR